MMTSSDNTVQRSRRGHALTEYALVIAFVALVAVLAFALGKNSFFSSVKASVNNASTHINNVTNAFPSVSSNPGGNTQ
jgi:hypothetical protein